jgi:hypothetical protein
VNPAHLEPVTRAENNRRKAAAITRCPQGHEYTPENSYRPPGTPNRRFCAACRHAARIRRAVKHLSPEMLNMLWTAAQMKYGWAWVPRRHGQHQVAEALVRRGLVVYERDYRRSRIWITEAGRAECERRWPVSPFVLGTYEHQPGGWTPREGVAA